MRLNPHNIFIPRVEFAYLLQYGNSALHYAAFTGQLDKASLLVTKGCNINIRATVSQI